MYIQRNFSKGKNGKTYSSTLLCEKYREDGKIKTKVITNLSHLPETLVLGIQNLLKDSQEALVKIKDIVVNRSIDFGLAFLLIHLMNKLRISEVFEKVLPSQAALLKAIIIGRIVTRGSKLGIYNWLKRNKEVCAKLKLDIDHIKVDDLYAALSAASFAQNKIERKWFLYHKGKHKEIFLYDITSTYFEGTQNVLAAYGYNRDGKKGKKQINIGLITDSDGFPLKISVFQGNVKDDQTVLDQIDILKNDFGTDRIIFVGDRGMKIRYHLDQLDQAKKEGIDYITGLTHAEIRELMDQDVIQLELFSKDLAEVEYQDKRYILSINEVLQERELEYLKAIRSIVDDGLTEIKASWEKRRNKNIENKKRIANGDKNKTLKMSFSKDDISAYKCRIAKVLSKRKMKKYYSIQEVSDTNFIVDFEASKYQQAKQLAGKYVVCTSLKVEKMDKKEIRQQYKNLQNVEHAYRDLKSDNIQVRPVYHRKKAQTRGHVLLTMFSYAIIKEMENKIFPFLKVWNPKKKRKLAFADIMEELNGIKQIELQLGKGIKLLKITQLNELQTEILKLFNMKKNDLDKGL